MPTIAKGGTAIKVACLECIRGHRSSQCVHVNKVLIEVRKPGRPLNAIPVSANGQDGTTASNLQPAYVVSGHSRCECPTTGVIPESDWKQTDSQPYPKGKNSEQAFRITKSSAKSRTPRLSISRKTSHLQQEGDRQNQTPTSAITSSSDTPSRPSCCSNKGQVSRSSSISQQNPDQQNNSIQNQRNPAIGQENTKPRFRFNEKHTDLDDFSNEPLKVIYDTQYDNMSDSQFRLFIDSLSPAEMVEIFPWRSNPRPWSSSKQGNQDQQSTNGQANLPGQEIKDVSQLVLNLDDASTPDECTCGDDCACLGCAMHPANATTMDHVREATEFMQNDPHYIDGSALMTFEHVAAVLQARQDSRMTSFARPGAAQFNNRNEVSVIHDAHDPLLKDMSSLGDQTQADFRMHSSSTISDSLASPSRIHASQRFDPQDAFLYTGFGHQQQAFAIHPFSGSGQVFVMSQQQRPSCVDDHGYCQCGPDCSCAGCQVHSTSHLGQTLPLGMSPHIASSDSSISNGIQSDLLTKVQNSTVFPTANTAHAAVSSSEISSSLMSPTNLNGEHGNRLDLDSGYARSAAEDIPVSWTASPLGSLFASPH